LQDPLLGRVKKRAEVSGIASPKIKTLDLGQANVPGVPKSTRESAQQPVKALAAVKERL
jgi:hypothetical protein